MIKTYTLSRDDLKSKNYKKAERTVTGEKITTRDINLISNILRRLPTK